MGDAHDRLAGLDPDRLAELAELAEPELRVRPCATCGTPTTRRWCSTACHRADEPGAYEPDDQPEAYD